MMIYAESEFQHFTPSIGTHRDFIFVRIHCYTYWHSAQNDCIENCGKTVINLLSYLPSVFRNLKAMNINLCRFYLPRLTCFIQEEGHVIKFNV